MCIRDRDIPVAYNSDLDAVTELLLETARRVRETTEEGKSILDDPEVWGVEQMSGESLTLRLAVKTAPLQQWAVARVLRAQIKRALDREGYRMPLANQSIIHQTSSFARITPEQAARAEQGATSSGTAAAVSAETSGPSAGSSSPGGGRSTGNGTPGSRQQSGRR